MPWVCRKCLEPLDRSKVSYEEKTISPISLTIKCPVCQETVSPTSDKTHSLVTEHTSKIATAIREAVAAEREACAKIADEVTEEDRYDCHPQGSREVASRIRARSQACSAKQ